MLLHTNEQKGEWRIAPLQLHLQREAARVPASRWVVTTKRHHNIGRLASRNIVKCTHFACSPGSHAAEQATDMKHPSAQEALKCSSYKSDGACIPPVVTAKPQTNTTALKLTSHSGHYERRRVEVPVCTCIRDRCETKIDRGLSACAQAPPPPPPSAQPQQPRSFFSVLRSLTLVGLTPTSTSTATSTSKMLGDLFFI
jgi:hypothetical protein